MSVQPPGVNPHSQQEPIACAHTETWTNTLFKAVFVGVLFFGALYAGYYFGFQNGAHGVIDAMQSYASSQVATSSSGAAALAIYNHPVASAQMPASVGFLQSFNWEAFRSYFVDQAVQASALMTASPVKMVEQAVSGLTAPINQGIETVTNTLYVGAFSLISCSASLFLFTTTQMIRAIKR